MENARMLDHRLRKIIREVSDSTGSEIRQDLVQELVQAVHQNQIKELQHLLYSLNRALKNIS